MGYKSKYYLPASARQPSLGLYLPWAMWVTSRLVAMPGWAWGVFWTLYALYLVAFVLEVKTKDPYSAEKMDRVLGGTP